MNNQRLMNFEVIAISEPYAWTTNNEVTTVPMGHSNWTKMIPTVQQGERWAFQSMLWIRKNLEAKQVPVQSSDLTAAVLRLPDRSMLVVSVYVEGENTAVLLDMTKKAAPANSGNTYQNWHPSGCGACEGLQSV
jgi:hypothetical protein